MQGCITLVDSCLVISIEAQSHPSGVGLLVATQKLQI